MPIAAAYRTMAIREFKAHLSAVLKRVQKGERIALTNHAEPGRSKGQAGKELRASEAL